MGYKMAGKILYNENALAARVIDSGKLPEGACLEGADSASLIRSRRELEDAAIAGDTIEAVCRMCDCTSMTLRVDLPGGVRGVIRKNEAAFIEDGGEIKDIALITRVGKAVRFKITEIYENERGEVIADLSRRAAQLECRENYIDKLRAGDIIPAKITHIEPFGAFCDIGGGIISLLTIDKISVSRISHPSDRFRVGENIHAVIASVDEGRIFLSHRELLGTWEENAAMFEAGQTVTGIVRSIEDYGVFIELAPNLAGLAEVTPGVMVGDVCSVYIKSILPEKMKIKLVLIDVCDSIPEDKMRYFIDPEAVKHIDRWVYSPRESRKSIESDFSPEKISV